MTEMTTSANTATATTSTKGQFPRRDHILEIEEWAQGVWRARGAYERNPPSEETALAAKKKYMATFPYPYMNGKLHLGHAFTVTKAEFAVRFQQLQGNLGFFPFAFHCTGMPIQAAAGNLARELAQHQQQQNDEEDEELVAAVAPQPDAAAASSDAGAPGVFRSKKSKAKAKTGGMSQWDILRSMGIPEEEIPAFVDPSHWLSYFPPLGQEDLTRFGLAIDWRRSFITTDKNPYYDAFIRWQFRKLKTGGFIGFGNRPAVFSRREQQPCADHDRASGEGVGCQEYTLIKLRICDALPAPMAAVIAKATSGEAAVSLVAATLRPETMYGQTNCYVLPEGEYGLFWAGAAHGYFVCSKRAADNLVWQGVGEKTLNPETGLLEAKPLCSVLGKTLLGLRVEAPLSLAKENTVRVLPMLTISMTKGTGVVTSVPSDSPDDFACLRDWKTKANWRTQHGVEEAWVELMEVVEIIEIPDFADMETQLASAGVESHRDREKLELVKKQTYLKGFDQGVMKVGAFAGKTVKEAKPLIRKLLVEELQVAVPYYEPESAVVSRSGDECVVALCDQWYIKYGEPQWMAQVTDHLKNSGFTMFNHKASNQQLNAVEWFKTWACSRTFGLGTKLPWDEKWVIESLSDSTIYMAYYAIAHFLQADMQGSKPGLAGLTPDQLTDELFDYVFLLKPADAVPAISGLAAETLQAMRREFAFWYPMDLRVSGKDLIPNHLTMALYIHAAIWPQQPELWPRAFFTNGHIEVDAEKMSKSKGNFLTIEHVNKEFGADATRIALADAGDDLENANFAKKTANDSILALYTLDHWIQEQFVKASAVDAAAGGLREGAYSFMDEVFKNELTRLVGECEAAYKRMSFRGALKAAWFDLGNLREQYRLLTEEEKMHKELVKLYVQVQALLLFPIAPHFCEHIWQRVLGNAASLASDASARWPSRLVSPSGYDLSLGRKFQVLQESLRQFRLDLKKWKPAAAASADQQSPDTAVIFVAKEYLGYQQEALRLLAATVEFDEATWEPLDRKYTSELKSKLTPGPTQALALKFAAFHVQTEVKARGREALELSLPFDEAQMFADQLGLIKKQLGVTHVEIRASSDVLPEDNGKQPKREQAIPAKPAILFLRRA